MSLIRTILGFVILLILIHVALVYVGINAGANTVTQAVYSLGALLESPERSWDGFLADMKAYRRSMAGR